ncbi:class I SAM-dependent DNA methyltransferase [Ornithinimicrobium cryptoxanthini]|uniref:Class I SAM-dependent methyltransferase n=1 Tax=Ornithinimicrobium cryptoxanthini TaxID=2934161 RepID=A0ABY4YGU1_9MICO|nr:class I SAM-dependent methyltransferase [Ornithinimicrobium cryptoxanthini]USQ75984.1 class I SAM-dependent methyltransferase [Ornithinimicrobium cryptoxanthini]
MDLTSLDHLPQDTLWDARAAAAYDTPGTGMFAPQVIGPTADRLAELAAGGAALEFAVGTGRVAILLAERGVPVTGIELSAPMIERLREKVDEQTLPVVHGDMATTRVGGDFSLVYLVFNTIGNLLTQDEQVECFRNAAAHLQPGGRFVIELWVPDLRGASPTAPAQVFTAEDGYVGLDVIDTVGQRIVSHHFRFDQGPSDPDASDQDASDQHPSGRRRATVDRTPHRYIWPAELDLMARLAGLELETRHADWEGSAFTADSGSHVSVYRLGPAD